MLALDTTGRLGRDIMCKVTIDFVYGWCHTVLIRLRVLCFSVGGQDRTVAYQSRGSNHRRLCCRDQLHSASKCVLCVVMHAEGSIGIPGGLQRWDVGWIADRQVGYLYLCGLGFGLDFLCLKCEKKFKYLSVGVLGQAINLSLRGTDRYSRSRKFT